MFMSISSEKLRKVLHPIQIDTMHFRFKPRRNPGSQSQHRSVNRTAVGLYVTNFPLAANRSDVSRIQIFMGALLN